MQKVPPQRNLANPGGAPGGLVTAWRVWVLLVCFVKSRESRMENPGSVWVSHSSSGPPCVTCEAGPLAPNAGRHGELISVSTHALNVGCALQKRRKLLERGGREGRVMAVSPDRVTVQLPARCRIASFFLLSLRLSLSLSRSVCRLPQHPVPLPALPALPARSISYAFFDIYYHWVVHSSRHLSPHRCSRKEDRRQLSVKVAGFGIEYPSLFPKEDREKRPSGPKNVCRFYKFHSEQLRA